jgi:hypothetical protein
MKGENPPEGGTPNIFSRSNFMRYMFLIYSQETPEGLPPEEVEELKKAHKAVMEDSARKGVLCGVDRLKATATATTIRMKNGKAITMDGPFAETKEQLAGYYILECQDLNEAIEWAKRIPSSCRGDAGCIEIRPIAELQKPH